MDKKASIKVLIADKHHIFRRGIRAMINEQKDMEIIGEADDDKTACKMIEECKPDVVLLDCILPNGSEEECAKFIAKAKQTKILISSDISDINFALRMLKLGASGYFLKDCKLDEVAIAIRKVFAGEIYLCKKFSRQFSCGQLNILIDKTKDLTSKEREIVKLITAGHSTREIAELLKIKSGTIVTHKRRIRKKLGINNDVELTKYAIRNGLTSLN